MTMTYPSVNIGKIAKVKGGKRLPLGSDFSAEETDHPYIRARDIRNGIIKLEAPVYINEKVFEKIKRYTVQANDVCIVIVGANVGDVGMVPLSLNGANLTENAVKLTELDGCDPFYLKYSLLTEEPQQEMKLFAGGAAQPKLGIYKVNDIKIPLPKLSGQRKIASILSAYDDLIENNNRRIKILEEMAQAIYKKWFVNFRFPGHEKVKMVKSKLGMIPEGWEGKSIGEILSYHIGGGWGKEALDDKHIVSAYVIRGTDIPNARYGAIANVPFRVHTESNLNSRLLVHGDIVFEVSGGSKDQPVGRALLMNERVLGQFKDKVMCASFCKLLRPDKKLILAEMLYLHLLEIYENRQIMKYQVQSTGITNFKFEHFLENETVIVPQRKIQDKFAEIVLPMLEHVQILGGKNANLRQTRDLLLPKLISGEVEVEKMDIQGMEASQ